MKKREEHQELDLIYLGYTIGDIHEFIDMAVKWLGAGHRIIHHTVSILDFVESIWNKEGRRIALFHILLDAKIIDGRKLLKKGKILIDNAGDKS